MTSDGKNSNEEKNETKKNTNLDLPKKESDYQSELKKRKEAHKNRSALSAQSNTVATDSSAKSK